MNEQPTRQSLKNEFKTGLQIQPWGSLKASLKESLNRLAHIQTNYLISVSYIRRERGDEFKEQFKSKFKRLFFKLRGVFIPPGV